MEDVELIEQDPGRFALRGDLSFATVNKALKASSSAFNSSPIEIDLGGVERADSAGLALLIEWLARARRQGIELRFLNIPEQILAMARASGLENVLPWQVEE